MSGTLAAAHDAILADLDGTLYRGAEAIPGAAEALASAGLTTVYVTNNASRSPEKTAVHLRELGFDADAGHVMTSAQAAVRMLGERIHAGARVLVVGHPSFAELATRAGFEVVASADDAPEAVLQGLSRELTWAELAEGCLALRTGVPWIASNTDATLPTERGLLPGNGSLVAALETATDRRPEVAGKPAPGVLRLAAEMVGSERPLVVGDRLDTDIEGGVAAGMPVLMVLTGVSTVADLLVAKPYRRPTHLAEGLGALNRPEGDSRIDAAPRPDAMLEGTTLVVGETRSSGVELARGILAEAWARGADTVRATDAETGARLREAGFDVA